MTITNETILAKAGDFVFCDSGEIHYSRPPSAENSVDFIVFDCDLLKPHCRTSGFLSPLITKEMMESCGIQAACKDMFNTVMTELENREPYYEEVVKAVLRRFWYLLQRCAPRNTTNVALRNKPPASLDTLQQLLAYLDTHYQENLPLETTAKMMHFSPSHFSKMFKDLIGINYVSYINMLRIEHACAQLPTARTILDVALGCGFSNIRTFNRTFKQLIGTTPSEFLKLPGADHYSLNFPQPKDADSQVIKENDSTMIIQYRRNENRLLE